MTDQTLSLSYRPLNIILIGDVMEQLRKIPDDYVDFIETSPPYWGKRNYQDIKSIWGGDPSCEHKWIQIPMGLTHENRNFRTGTQEEIAMNPTKTSWIRKFDERRSGYCAKCKAWLGQLGLERTFQDYVEHLLMVTKEIYRILKPTGNFYLNIADTYAGSGQGSQTGAGDYKRKRVIGTMDSSVSRDQTVPDRSLCDIPHRLAIKMVDEQYWIQRDKIIWKKDNHMPSSDPSKLTPSYEFIFRFTKGTKTALWKNMLTKQWIKHRPPKQLWRDNGRITDIWKWWCIHCNVDGQGATLVERKAQRKLRKQHAEETKKDSFKHETRSLPVLWRGFKEYFDIDEIRVPNKVVGVTDMRPAGIIRQKLYAGSKYNRVEDEHLKQFQGNFPLEGKYAKTGDVGENMGSPRRARNEAIRKQDSVPGPNAGMYEGFNDRWKADHSFEEVLDQTLDNGILTGGDGRTRAGLDSKPVEEKSHPKGKNPGNVITSKYSDPNSPIIEHHRQKGSGGNYDYGGLNAVDGRHYSDGGKGPKDVILGKEDYWTINTKGFKGAHFAVYPEELCEDPVKSSCPPHTYRCNQCEEEWISEPKGSCPNCLSKDADTLPAGIGLDPFEGSGTTLVVLARHKRNWLGIELNPTYVSLAYARLYKNGFWVEEVPGIWKPPNPILDSFCQEEK